MTVERMVIGSTAIVIVILVALAAGGVIDWLIAGVIAAVFVVSDATMIGVLRRSRDG